MDFLSDVWAYALANKLEMISVVFSILSVWYASRENILLYPTGLVAVAIASYIYLNSKLYADVAVQVYYFAASVYGWIFWVKLQKEHKSVSQIQSGREWLFYVGLTVLAWGAFYSVLIFTDTDIPFWDSLVNAIFITGMVLMARKRIENWLFWIVSDIGSIFISLYKDLNFFAAQYILFTLLAIYAYVEWRKKLTHAAAV